MSLETRDYQARHALENIKKDLDSKLLRINTQVDFARKFAKALNNDEWTSIIEEAYNLAENIDINNIDSATKEIEKILSPIGKVAKEYNIHCVGHAHIDMNWMWAWPETVNAAHDTFYTIDKIMDEFEDVKFSQSQISLYKAMKDHCPEIWKKINKRIKEGRWEITASSWVEGEKNCVSGESIFRHNLYSKQFLKEEMDINPDNVKIDWSPDTFGHAEQLPSILNKAGVTRYYRMRPHKGPVLFKWRSPDGGEVLCFRETDPVWGYNGPLNEAVHNCFTAYVKETNAKAKDFMYLYGWGDHGGGPTRDHIKQAKNLQSFPIYPNIIFSTTDQFYTAIENQMDNLDLPVVEGDINYIFEGCYTSQSNVKYANRISELEIPAAETMAIIGNNVSEMEYPYESIKDAWQKALFNHFHDIFPGSGVCATYTYAQGTFQEILATTSTIKTRVLKKLAENINTSIIAKNFVAKNIGDSMGAGVGDLTYTKSNYEIGKNPFTNTLAYDTYQPTAASIGGEDAEPIIVYNPKPWTRSEVILVKIWNKTIEEDKVCVIDSEGNKIKAQIVDKGDYWGHKYHALLFEAKDIPALGYKVYAVDVCYDEIKTDNAVTIKSENNNYKNSFENTVCGMYTIENEFLTLTLDTSTGSLISVIDKETGFDYVRAGEGLGEVEYQIEQGNDMPAWALGEIKYREVLDKGTSKIVEKGPNKVIVRTDFEVSKSMVSLETSLSRGSRNIDFKLRTRWLEVGSAKEGMPTLRTYFAANIDDATPRHETPFGYKEIEQSSQEVPALKWFDLSGDTEYGNHGITLTNRSKYGHACKDDTISLTLLRSSYEPDPYPELGDHVIEYSVNFHNKDFDVIDAVRLGENFNNPLIFGSVPVQEGTLPLEMSFANILTDNINISAIKKAEDGNGIVIRIYELTNKDTVAKINIAGLIKDAKEAYEVDTLERPIDKNTAKITDGILSVKVKAYSNTTIYIK